MKGLFLGIGFLSILLLSESPAFADAAPVWWSLPNRGKNCVMKSAFTDGSITCGTKRYEVWSCVSPSANSFSPASSSDYLIVGEYRSDIINQCSPTFVAEKWIKQN